MRAVYLTGHGGTDKLDIRDDAPAPTTATNEVLVKVAAAGMNNTDINTRIACIQKVMLPRKMPAGQERHSNSPEFRALMFAVRLWLLAALSAKNVLASGY